MALSNAPAAQSGVRASIDALAQQVPGASTRGEPVVLLLLGKRSTVRHLDDSLPSDGRVQNPANDLALEFHFGSPQLIHLLVVTSQRAALRQVKTKPPRAVLVELDNRPQSREHFCHTLRRRIPAMAILAVGDKRPAGQFPFDDYVPLPLTQERAEAAVDKLRASPSSQILECGPFELNLATRTVYTPNGPRRLTPKLCALLKLFMNHRNEVVTRPEIMESIWETSYLEDTRTLDVHVRWLRESIEPDPYSPQYILTERGKGYTFHCC